MDWKLKVPKILHVYWGGSKLSYLRYLTVLTFMKENPDWEIRYYYPSHPTTTKTWVTPENKLEQPETDFSDALMGLPITKILVNFESLGHSNAISEVHKSDILRLHLLSTIGGMWSDMDIFYFKPMNDFYLNKAEYRHIETFYCNREYGHSIGFLLATPMNKFFRELFERSRYSYSKEFYQTFGAKLYNRYFREEGTVEKITPYAINIDMDVVYSHCAGNTPELLDPKQKPNFTKKSLGIHWYGGDEVWGDFLLDTDGGLKNVPKCIIGDLIKKFKK